MSDDEHNYEVVVSPQAQAEIDQIIAEHPDFADHLRELFANFRQAMHAVHTGQHEDFGEAMEAITGKTCKPLGDV